MPGTTAPAAAATPAAPAADPNVIDVSATEITDEDFANAFDAAAGNTPAAAPAADASAAPAVGATDPADSAAAPAPAAGAATTDGAAPAATPAAPAVDGAASPAAAPAATPAPTPPADNGGADGGVTVESLQAEIAALKAAQAQAPAAPAQAPAAPAQAPAEQPIYSAAEQTALDAYKAEWPDVAAGEALIRRQEYQQLMGIIFQQIQPHLDRLYSQGNVTHERTQYQALRELVPDYDDIRDPTLAWINTQPAYLKDAFSKVANEGTPEQVADIITRFRKETGWVKPGAAPAAPAQSPAAAAPTPAAPAAAPTPAAPAAAPAAAVAAAAAALKPVGAARTSATAAADPNDFDGAFAEASASMSK